jgi:phosphatidylserine/phosphatidylglycerophosphate/cardiolipin synthase-like enzyme
VVPHLKLLTVDGDAAYIGSANMTFAGMTTNFEVGALVEGSAVVAFETLVDDLVKRAQCPPPEAESALGDQ